MILHFTGAIVQWRIQDLPKGGGRADHGKRMEHLTGSLGANRGSGGRAPSRVQEQSPWWGSGRSPLKLKAFCKFLYKKSDQKLRI